MASEKHFVIIPFPAFGHIIPMLELAKKIRQKSKVTFVISAMKLPSIQERKLLPVDLPVVTFEDGLSDDYDKDLEPKQFMMATQKMLVPLTKLFESICVPRKVPEGPIKTPVTAVVMDMMYCKGFLVCHSLGIPVYLFDCAAAWTLTGGLHMDENTPTVPDDTFFNPDPNVTFDDMSRAGIPESFKDMAMFLFKSYPLVEAVVINSFEDLEPTSKAIFESHPKSGGTSMKFVGPLFPDDETPSAVDGSVRSWLDKQKEGSVIFVSFGSMAIPLPEQIAEIAQALSELNKPFIWSLRSSQHHHLPEWFRQLMEKGFDGAFLVLPWAPQKLILGHPSIQVFVSHCGWNSTLEGVSSGVPTVAWPMFADQHFNADFLVKLGTAVKIPDTSVKAKRVVSKNELMDAVVKVTEIAHGTEGNSYIRTAREFAIKARIAVSKGGKSQTDFEELFW